MTRGILKNKRAALQISFAVLGLIAIALTIFYLPTVFANTHTADVTISPNLISCNLSSYLLSYLR